MSRLNALVIDNKTIQHVYLVGIGGIGMGGLAQVLIDRGFQVSGSDLVENTVVNQLKQRGATITLGHDLCHLETVDLVVYSSAIRESNPIFHSVKSKGVPCIRRAEMLALLVEHNRVVAVAGTHGKTTTSGLISETLERAGQPVGRFVGGYAKGGSMLASDSRNEWTVIEADESDASLLTLNPELAIVTNVEPDHLENYPGGFPQIIETFRQFLKQVSDSGKAFVCIDCPGVKKVMEKLDVACVTYGFDSAAEVRVTGFVQQHSHAEVTIEGLEERPTQVKMGLVGRHNALNLCAALLVAKHLGCMADFIEQAGVFRGMARRFHQHGHWHLGDARVHLVEDYGHHPKELEVTISSARHLWPDRRLVMLFQPHRYSRTALLLKDFARVLTQVNHVILMPVYAAGEASIPKGTSEALHEKCLKFGGKKPSLSLIREQDCVLTHLQATLQDHDILIMQGAGDIGMWVQHIVKDPAFIKEGELLC